VVPPLFATSSRIVTFPCASHRNPLTVVSRRRLLVHIGAVRGEAPRSYSPANPIPLLNNRGSLFRLDRLLVLIVALTILDCRGPLCTSGMRAVNEATGFRRAHLGSRSLPPTASATMRDNCNHFKDTW